MASLSLCRNRIEKSSRSWTFEKEPLISELKQHSKSSTQQKRGQKTSGSECVPWLYVADARHASEDVMLFPFFDKCKLNVQCDDAGIGSWLEWLWPVAEIALFEESDPEDPEYPRLKPVGVYPVKRGWAYIDMEDVAGKGQDHNKPLYVVAGTAVMKRLGCGLHRRLHSLKFANPS